MSIYLGGQFLYNTSPHSNLRFTGAKILFVGFVHCPIASTKQVPSSTNFSGREDEWPECGATKHEDRRGTKKQRYTRSPGKKAGENEDTAA